jgi:hypothetical protein
MRTFVIVLLLAMGRVALAGVPAHMPVQGYLTDASNTAVNGTVQIQFQIYSAATGGTAIYSETQAVAVDHGSLTVYLGSNVPLDMKLFRGGSAFLGITIQGEAEMSPRLELATVPFAAYAQETAAVPPGAVMMFDLDACPPGWSALDSARGRAIVGVPSGGTRGATVGTALADAENRSHTHSVDPAACTTSVDGGHTHVVDPVGINHSHTVDPTSITVTGGAHNHAWANFDTATKIWSAWTSTGVTPQQLVDWNNGVDGAGATGDYPIEFTSAPATGRVYTEQSSHSHTVDIPQTNTSTVTVDIAATTSTTAGAHSHTCDVAATTSTASTTGQVMPYLQLLVCRKD